METWQQILICLLFIGGAMYLMGSWPKINLSFSSSAEGQSFPRFVPLVHRPLHPGDEVLLPGTPSPTAAERQMIMRHGISRVSKKIYLTDAYSSRQYAVISTLGITHILSIGREQKPHDNPLFTTLHISIHDTPAERDSLEQELDKAVAFIDSAPGPVLVHCYAGISRSATVVAYYLMIHGMSLDESLRAIRRARPIINPNSGFMALLRQKEQAMLI